MPHRAARSLSRCSPLRRAAALLEVVISVSILLLAMSVIGLAFRNGLDNVEMADRISRADLLTENLLNAISSGLVSIGEAEQSGSFGAYAEEGMFWTVEVVPDKATAGLLHGTIHVYRGDPQGPENQRHLIATSYVDRITPKGIDFQRDFGLTQEQIDTLVAAVPGGEAVLNPTNYDPHSLSRLPMDALVEILPALMEAFGGAFIAGQMDKILQAVQQGDLAGLQKIMESAAQAQQAGQDGADPLKEPESPTQVSPVPIGGERPSQRVRGGTGVKR